MQKRNFLILLILTTLLMQTTAFASQTDGTINTGSNIGFAWSNNVGWVNFAPNGGNIHITDSGITGYAWNDKSGWISLSPTNGGIINNDGTLSGYAWGTGLGWINFSGVTIDTNGQFHGQATGDVIGSLTFDCANCNITTDWRPISARTTPPVPPTPSPTPPVAGNGGAIDILNQSITSTQTPVSITNANTINDQEANPVNVVTNNTTPQTPNTDDPLLASIGQAQPVLFDISIQPVFASLGQLKQFSVILILLFISCLILFIIYRIRMRLKINKINTIHKT